MISDRSHHVVGSISGPGDGTGAHLKNSSLNHLNGGLVVGPGSTAAAAAAAAQHQANLMAGMNLINQGFHQHQQQGNHLSNIHALQQQHNNGHSLMGHAILGSGSVSSAGVTAAVTTNTGNLIQNSNNNQNYDYAVRLAAEANSKATIEKDYYKAIILYGDAISLHDSDCRFFLNRSFCYAQLELYQLALDDAEQAIKLDPKSGKSFYRKGQALIGLKKYMDAEKAFQQVLRLEPDCPETSKQLTEVRLLSLQSLGFDPDKSQMAALKYKSIEQAISALLALRIDDSAAFSDDLQQQQPAGPGGKWTATSSMWDHHHSDPQQQPPPQQKQAQQAPAWASLAGGQQQQHQSNGSDVTLIGSGLRNNAANAAVGAGVIGSGQSQQQQHLINGYGSEHFSTKAAVGVNGDVSASNSHMVSSSVSNGFSSIVGSNGSAGFYQRSNERPNSSSPLDKLTDSLSSINQQQQQHLSSHQHHQQMQMVIGNNTINAGSNGNSSSNSNSQQNRLMSSGGLMNHHLNDQISVFDGSCIGKMQPASYSSAAHVANGTGMSNHVSHGTAAATSAEHHPKNNAANNFNNICNSFSNHTSSSSTSAASLLIKNHKQQQQQLLQHQHQNQASAVIGSGRHASGSSSGHVSSAITIGSFGLTSVAAAGGLSIGSSGGVGAGGESEPSISPSGASNSDSDSSVTITDPAANHRFNHHQVMVGAVNSYAHQHQQIAGNCLINGSSSSSGAPAAAAVASGGGSVWGSGGGGSAGGTFADIVKKKSAAPAAPGSKSCNSSNNNNINNNNNNNSSSSRKGEITLNGRNHHNQPKPKDQTITSSLESDADPSNHSMKDQSISGKASLISKRPTNIWGYNGLRVANVSPTSSRSTLTSIFSKFGKLKPVERITNKNVENQIWVFYDNPVSPVDVIAKYQGLVVPGISLNNNTPLKFYFAATDDQKDLKFSRPKQPQDSRGECYYWRTTNCFSRESCSLLHLPSCKNIDAQVWMKMNREPNNTSNNGTNGTN